MDHMHSQKEIKIIKPSPNEEVTEDSKRLGLPVIVHLIYNNCIISPDDINWDIVVVDMQETYEVIQIKKIG